jgi:hypothetical protein
MAHNTEILKDSKKILRNMYSLKIRPRFKIKGSRNLKAKFQNEEGTNLCLKFK